MAREKASVLILTFLGALLLTGALVHWMGLAGVASAHDSPAYGEAVRSRGAASPVGTDGRSERADALGVCRDGEQDSGAKYRICMPVSWWTNDLVVYAHGYMAPDRPVEIPEDQMSLPGFPGTIDEIINNMGMAFATTSYRTNGLAVRPAISDLLDLVNIFTTTEGIPTRIYLVGVSEGGLITTLSVERHADIYDGGLAMCGPYGDFQGQINHFGDFRVVFDYFFPDLMPGEPLSIPTNLMEGWDDFFATEVEPIITDPARAVEVNQLLGVTDVSPYAYLPPTSTGSIENLLWYNVFATNDGVAKLGGQPFDNHDPYRWYSGSQNDVRLNDPQLGVERISADPAALDAIDDHYQTTGHLSVPLVTMHTTGDPIVPYWHAARYRGKAILADNRALHHHIEVDRHGHCAFDYTDVSGAFNTLRQMVANPPDYWPVSRSFLPEVAATP